MSDEFQYHAYVVGRPTRTAEVKAPHGTSTVEKGTLTFEMRHKHDLHEVREQDGWVAHYVAPDGGVGFGIGEDNSGGVAVPYDLVDVIELPRAMTRKEAADWLNDERAKQYRDETIESDVTASDLMEAFR